MSIKTYWTLTGIYNFEWAVEPWNSIRIIAGHGTDRFTSETSERQLKAENGRIPLFFNLFDIKTLTL